MKTLTADCLRRITSDIFRACQAPDKEANTVAEILVLSNLLGLDSHGVIRIPQYVQLIEEKKILPGGALTIKHETATTTVLDVGLNFGQVGAKRATEIAIEKARKNGIGSSILHRSNHVGCLGVYTRMAAKQNFIAIGSCGSPGGGHWVSPYGGREGRLATNPISFAAPSSEDPIVMDISTSMASEGKIRLMRNRHEQLGKGWILDANGSPSTDPNKFYGPPMGVILPLGGSLGYKGFALSVMAQILCTQLGGVDWRPENPLGYGNCMWILVINIESFTPVEKFKQEMNEYIRYLKSSAPAPGFEEVVIPGELDNRAMKERKSNGINIEDETWGQIEEVAQKLNVRL